MKNELPRKNLRGIPVGKVLLSALALSEAEGSSSKATDEVFARKNKTKKRHFSAAIGIPTFEGGESLVHTLRSIYDQTVFNLIGEVLVVSDGRKIEKSILERIENKKLKVIHYKKRKGQSARINDILHNLDADLIFLANDDIILEKNTIEKLMKEFRKSKTDLIASCVKPLQPQNMLERIIAISYELTHLVYRSWNKGDNYLACNGRLIGLSRKLARKLKIAESIWNNDAFIYLTAKLNGLTFKHMEGAYCYFRSPGTFKEHIKQSMKFQKSLSENRSFFKSDISCYFDIPFKNKLLSIVSLLPKDPIGTFLYFYIYLYSRFTQKTMRNTLLKKGYWETDTTTKVLSVGEIHLNIVTKR